MHNIRDIRANPQAFEQALNRREIYGVTDQILALDAEWRARVNAADNAQAALNKNAADAGAAKKAGNQAEFDRLCANNRPLKDVLNDANDAAMVASVKLNEVMLAVPNTPLDSVPNGKDENDNVFVSAWGAPGAFDFKPQQHFDIPAARHGLDFDTGAKLAGARFVVLKGAMATLHRALGQFMLDTHVTEHGMEETWTPVLVREEMMWGTGQLPKFGEDSYQTSDGQWLIPTAEVTLTNTIHGDILDGATLPRRLVALTQCFRSEAGSAGRDTKGMIRQHQFEKVEMVSITTPEDGLAEHARLTRCAQTVLERLELPHRTVMLCVGDMGAGAKITHDIEVWLPGQKRYREISSVSYCGDYQARRMNTRYRPKISQKTQFVHTLNGSGVAVGRALIAVLENGQQADGSVHLPKALAPYLRGATLVTKDGQLA